ncbi:MAG: sulfoxide reductase heme-binding subunit YedZ [Gammaproteobacteria bacterium]|nr:sulfoxide reductase heme-binding subunit YedZ [Gammaproteobacteria bacterium]
MTARSVRGLKVLMWVSALAPAAWIAGGTFRGWLGVNPIEKVTHVTGLSALVLLLLTLAVTPVRRMARWNRLIQLRRPLGLFAFFYAFLHFSIWMALDLGFQLSWISEDIMERPYITVGFTAFVLLIPLAVTSTRGWIRRLGRRWATLHRLVYITATLGVIHFYWLVKADTSLPLLFAGILTLLLASRIGPWHEKRKRRQAASARRRQQLSTG